MSSSAFETSYGFPRSDVRLSNWRQAPWNVWSFRHVCELIPTARISATPGLVEGPPVDAEGLLGEELSVRGERTTVADILRRTSTDALVVMKSGRIVADIHAPNFTLQSRHILFSASKSVTSIVAGVLHGDGLLDLDQQVPHYVPELKSSAYADARIRDVLDMRVSLDFEEIYQDPRGDFARYRRAGLLEPVAPGQAAETLIEFLSSLKKGPGVTMAPSTTHPRIPTFWAWSSNAHPASVLRISSRGVFGSRSEQGRMPMSRSMRPARRGPVAASA